MSIDPLNDLVPDFAKDVRLNLSSMVADESLGGQTPGVAAAAIQTAVRFAAIIQSVAIAIEAGGSAVRIAAE